MPRKKGLNKQEIMAILLQEIAAWAEREQRETGPMLEQAIGRRAECIWIYGLLSGEVKP